MRRITNDFAHRDGQELEFLFAEQGACPPVFFMMRRWPWFHQVCVIILRNLRVPRILTYTMGR